MSSTFDDNVSRDPSFQILCIESMPFAENSYVIWREGSNESVIVDPGFQPALIVKAVEQSSTKPVAILLTHGHSDHIAGNKALKERWPDIPILIGEFDADKLTDPMKNLSAMFGASLISPPADRLLADHEKITFAGIEWRIAFTPGHCRGHIVFIAEQFHPPVVIGGDVLFAGSIGRTDFPDGNHEQLLSSIRERLFTLPDETIVYPGHNEPTTIGVEKRTNPFLQD
jgi:glyoxylase-like metal-dependent hydrolase (beta-lactamase superfamily II)